jgi:hypothetical protein
MGEPRMSNVQRRPHDSQDSQRPRVGQLLGAGHTAHTGGVWLPMLIENPHSSMLKKRPFMRDISHVAVTESGGARDSRTDAASEAIYRVRADWEPLPPAVQPRLWLLGGAQARGKNWGQHGGTNAGATHDQKGRHVSHPAATLPRHRAVGNAKSRWPVKKKQPWRPKRRQARPRTS